MADFICCEDKDKDKDKDKGVGHSAKGSAKGSVIHIDTFDGGRDGD